MLARSVCVSVLACLLGGSLGRAQADEGLSAGDQKLLQRHSPVLVIFPHKADHRRPGMGVWGKPSNIGFSDYHPMSVEKFRDRGYLDTGRSRPSGPKEMWQSAKRRLDQRGDRPSDDKVVYGRVVPEQGGGKILQYYYLYEYNDFVNRHEGDWEMASIRLDRRGRPVEMGLSSHHGGTKLDWGDVQKDGDRPVAYVSRGSHAMYFGHQRRGYPVVDVTTSGGVKRLLKAAARFDRLRDQVPIDPKDSQRALAIERGVRIENLQVRSLPSWARRYRGHWGSAKSSRLRVIGSAPRGPWATTDARWHNPTAWMHSLRPAKPAQSMASRTAKRIARPKFRRLGRMTSSLRRKLTKVGRRRKASKRHRAQGGRSKMRTAKTR